MKAYLIDPEAREVSEVEVDDDNDMKMLHSIYKLMRCTAIEAVNPLNAGHDIIYLDENGKLKPNIYWLCRLWPYEGLAGRGLWIGCNGKGGNRAPDMKLDYVQAHIVWGPL